MYYNGEKVNLEDNVIDGFEEGIIKAIIHEDLFSEDLNPSDFQYLESGYLVLTDFGLLYLEELYSDIFLVSRS